MDAEEGAARKIDPEEWARVRVVFENAVAMDPRERAAYLDSACGSDESLRREVASLLAAASGAAWIDYPIADGGSETKTVERPAEAGPVAPGQSLGPYVIGEQIGAGGMGAVYRATDQRLGRTVAIKVIRRSGTVSGVDRARFFREAKAASALNHPNIATVYEYDSKGEVDYIVMEFVDGMTLDRFAADQPALAVLLDCAVQAASAIAKAHQAGIVHRDLKPRNILVTPERTVKVLDFGLAKLGAPGEGAAAESDGLTRPGTTLGTPAYMSPEQARGETLDQRSDIFSFGTILYQMASGRNPFDRPTQLSTLHAIAYEEPEPVERAVPGVPRRLAALIRRCLEKDKQARPRTMEEVRAELLEIARAVEPAAPQARKGKAYWALSVTAAVALFIAGWLWQSSRHGAAGQPRRVLTYSFEAIRRDAAGAAGAPYRASTGEVFRGGDKFRLRIESPQAGFLYVVNEGPGAQGRQRIWMLFPRAPGAAALPPSHAAEAGWYVFDENPGAERLWLVWSEQPSGALEEALRGADRGEVRDPGRAIEVQKYLGGLARAKAVDAGAADPAVRLTSNEATLGAVFLVRHQ